MKKMMTLWILMLVLSAAFIVPTLQVFAEETSLKATEALPLPQRQKLIPLKQRIETARMNIKVNNHHSDAVDIEDLDYEDVDEIMDKIEEAESIEETNLRPLWLVWTRGQAWTEEPVNDAATITGIPIGMRILAKPIKYTKFGSLYEIIRGQLRLGEEIKEVTGYAIKVNNVFGMILNGDNIDLRAIGRIHPVGIGFKVAMKGKLDFDSEGYYFKMHGRAVRFNVFRRLRNTKRQNMGQAEVEAPQS
jgi:hypothetical protein